MSRRSLGFASAALFLFLLLSSRAARGDEAPPCGGPGHPGIVVKSEGLDPALRTKILGQLRAALAGRSFELCEAGSSSEGAVAELDLSTASGAATAIALTLSVRDAVTDKRVSRDIDLRRIPEDGRALAIAQAADELLRASWAELLIADAPPPKRDVPPEIVRAVPPPQREPVPPVASAPRAPVVELGAGIGAEHFTSGHTQLGPDLSAGIFPLARAGAVVRLGLRTGAKEDAAAGSVDPNGLAAALAFVAGVLPRAGSLGLDAGAEVFVTHVTYDAESRTSARARSESGTAAHISAIARGWALVARPLRVSLSLSLGAPLHTVRAVAGDRTIASIGGVLLGGQIGLAGAW